METTMMVYYLLRNNKESGPFTEKELKELPLLTTDLVWVNGESTCWKSPEEIEPLQALAKEPEKVIPKPTEKQQAKAPVFPAGHTATEFSLHQLQSTPVFADAPDNHFNEEPLLKPSFDALEKKYAAKAPRKKVWKSQIDIGANLIGIATLVIGVSVAAFMIKKAVDNIEYAPVIATAEAVEIGESGQYTNTSSQAAKVTTPVNTAVSRQQPAVVETTPSQNSTPGVAVDQKTDFTVSTPPPVVVKKENRPVVKEKETPAKQEVQKEKSTQKESAGADDSVNNGNDTTENITAKKEGAENKNGASQVQLSANEYKVGFLGGVSNLQLSVTNASAQTISKAVVEVEYLKPNGKSVGSQIVEVSGIAPGSSRKVSVPDNSRGVSVRYKVISVEN